MRNKGAMFGLDARIALAIFGALSVISGAALYSAIQNAKATAYHTEMRELTKAVEAYYLDTGSQLPGFQTTQAISYLNSNELYSSTVPGWKGPYLSWTDTNAAIGIITMPRPQPANFLITVATDKAWGGNDNHSDDSAELDCRAANEICHIWVIFEYFTLSQLPMLEGLDEKIDGTIDYENGNFRIRQWTSNSVSVYLKIMPYKK